MKSDVFSSIVIGGVVIVGIAGAVFITTEIVKEFQEPDSGTVTFLEYQEDYYIPVTQCTTSGKSTVCQTVQQYVPECWYVEYKDEDGEVGDDCTSESTFKELILGSQYTNE